MADTRVGRLPVPGRWYDDQTDFEALDSAARPRRGVTSPEWNVPQVRPTGVRKRFRARPSKGEVAPWGGRFYWCAFCNYVNTEEDGQAVRCPAHRREWERVKKQGQRAFERALRERSDEAIALTLTYANVRELQRLALIADRAGTRLRRDLTASKGRPSTSVLGGVGSLLEADTQLLALVRDWFERLREQEEQ